MRLTLMTTHTINIEPAGGQRHADVYLARFGDRTLATSRTPFFDAARKLIELEYPPSDRIVMRHAGSETELLKATIGAAAKLTGTDTAGGKPRFAKWVDLAAVWAREE